MVVLNFTVNKQNLVLNTDVSGFLPVSDTVNYYKCEFDFDETWAGFDNRVYFKNESYNIVKSVLLGSSNTCFIPWEVLAHTGVITCSVVGLKINNNIVTQRLTTNPAKFMIQVEESVLTPYEQEPLTPTEYEQFRAHFDSTYLDTVAAKEAAISAKEDAEAVSVDVSTYTSQAHDYKEDSEAYAVGTRDGYAVTSDDPAYDNNSKYYSEQANLYKQAAVDAKTDAVDAKNDATNARIDAEAAEYNSGIYATLSEAYAKGTRNSSPVTSGDVAYHNNSKYFSEQASNSANDAYNSQNTASAAASDSKAYAIGKRGNNDVTSSDPAYHNNSKYYSEQAASSAQICNEALTNSGIVDMTIDENDHLIYTKTSVVGIDFDIDDNGHLVVS